MIEISHLNKTFYLKTGNVEAVRDVSLSIADGEIYGVIGYSGAGKSTLVRLINLLEIPDSGELSVGGSGTIAIRGGVLTQNGVRMKEKQLSELRRGIGMIFQHFNLLDRSTVFDNIAYPLKYSGRSKQEIRRRVTELLELVGLTDKIDTYPSQLSGGQKQRVAIARALANDPKVLLSDEATSALDPDATESILNLLKDLNRKLGLTIVIITHEMAVIKAIANRVAVMEDGRVVEEGSVYDVFSHPREQITKRFVNSAFTLSKVDKLIKDDSELVRVSGAQKLVRLTFNRDSVGESLISSVSRTYNVNLNIVLASVEILEGMPLGGMIAIIDGEPENVERTLVSLRESRVDVQILSEGGRE